MTALKSLLDNSVIHVISMLVSVECIFPFKLIVSSYDE